MASKNSSGRPADPDVPDDADVPADDSEDVTAAMPDGDDALLDDDAAEPAVADETADKDAAKKAKSQRPVKKAAAAPVEDEAEEEEDVPAVRQASRKLTTAPVKKGRATRKRDEVQQASTTRTTPLMFARQSIAELRKVVWPSGQITSQYFIVVLVFVLFVMGVVAGLDYFFGWSLLKLLG